MAPLTPITGKNQVDTKEHAAVDAIVQTRGASVAGARTAGKAPAGSRNSN